MFDALLKHMGLVQVPADARELRAPCPFEEHSSEHPMSVNFSKGVAKCHACGVGWTLLELEQKMSGGNDSHDEITTEAFMDGLTPAHSDYTPESVSLGTQAASEFWVGRGYTEVGPDGVDWADLGDRIRVYSHEGEHSYQDRMLSSDGPRYLTPEGGAGLFYYGDINSSEAWIAEGPFDALALYAAGAPLTVAGLGADGAVSDKLAYRLRGKTAIFVLDRDFAGYSAAKKAPKTYEEFGARTLVQELPNEAGKDPGQWWEKNPDGLREWIAEIRQRWLSEGDIGFVTELFDPSTAQLPTLPTGITELDKLLKGGYAPGLHIVAGEPAAGKSALVQYLTRTWANAGHRVLEVSTELPPRQVWARIISPVVGIDWNELEATPGKFSYVRDNAKVGQLASMISVLGNVSIAEISLAATRYDIIVIDYLQAMSEVQEDPRLAINKLLRELTNLSLNQGKVIILVSEYGRHVYRRNADGSKPTPDKTSYKESGSIEYRAQSALNLVRGEGSKIMEGHLVKNTRGFEGRFFMKVSLESNMFEDYYVAGGE